MWLATVAAEAETLAAVASSCWSEAVALVTALDTEELVSPAPVSPAVRLLAFFSAASRSFNKAAEISNGEANLDEPYDGRNRIFVVRR